MHIRAAGFAGTLVVETERHCDVGAIFPRHSAHSASRNHQLALMFPKCSRARRV